MIVSVHQPQYIPWIGYFDKIDKSDIFVFLDDVQYKKREWQNRNRIKTPDGLQWLTVPVKHNDNDPINRVLIQNESSYINDHILGIELNYKKAKYFNEYKNIIFDAVLKKHEKLSDLNISLIEVIIRILGIEKNVILSSSLNIETMKTDRIIDICKALDADVYLSGEGARDYLQPEKFSANNIRLTYQRFSHPVYAQLFGEFLPFASIIDMIFNMGADTLRLIREANTYKV